MKKTLTSFFLIFISLITISFIAGSPFVFSDGYGYYHVGKTLVDHGTFATNVKPEYYDYSAHTTNIFDDRYVTVYSSANSIFWWPFLTTAKQFDTGTIDSDYFKAYNGHSLADGIAIEVASCFYGAILILIMYQLLRDLKFSKKVSKTATFIALIASFIFGYIFINASYSHLYEALSLTVLLFALVRFNILHNQKYMLIAGIFSGFLVLSRPANLVLLIPIVIYLLTYKKIKILLTYILGSIPIALIFFTYNYSSFHKIIANGYQILWTMDFDFSKFNLFLLLFSDVRGWFVYSPIIILSLIGLIFYCRKNLKKSLVYIAPIIMIVGLYSFWPSWWAGDSVGQRFFLVLLPIIAVGISVFISKVTRLKPLLKICSLALISLLTFYSATILVLYRTSDVTILNEYNTFTAKAYPEISPAERYTPFDLVKYNVESIISGQKIAQSKDKSLLQILRGNTDTIIKAENIDDNSFKLNVIPNPYTKSGVITFQVFIIRNNFQLGYKFVNIDITSNSNIIFNCQENECIPNKPFTIITEGKAFPQQDLIPVNPQTKIKLESLSNVNLVDYKIESFKRWFNK